MSSIRYVTPSSVTNPPNIGWETSGSYVDQMVVTCTATANPSATGTAKIAAPKRVLTISAAQRSHHQGGRGEGADRKQEKHEVVDPGGRDAVPRRTEHGSLEGELECEADREEVASLAIDEGRQGCRSSCRFPMGADHSDRTSQD